MLSEWWGAFSIGLGLDVVALDVSFLIGESCLFGDRFGQCSELNAQSARCSRNSDRVGDSLWKDGDEGMKGRKEGMLIEP